MKPFYRDAELQEWRVEWDGRTFYVQYHNRPRNKWTGVELTEHNEYRPIDPLLAFAIAQEAKVVDIDGKQSWRRETLA